MTGIISASYTLSLGVQPGQIQVECADAVFESLNPIGDLVLMDGSFAITIADCRVADFTASYGGSGQGYRVVLEDARWKLRYRLPAEGKFNVPNADGTVIEETKCAASDLAKVLFWEVIGSELLPADDYPFFEWQLTPRADALSQLCEMYGCAVAWLPNGTLKIVKLGEGWNYDTDGRISEANGEKIKNHARTLLLVFGKTEIQANLELEAVGLDLDGTIKLLDDLSYKPAAGWTAQGDLDFFRHLDPAGDAVKCARASVWKWYRVKEDLPAGFTLMFFNKYYAPDRPVVGSGISSKLKSYLPLIPKLVFGLSSADKIRNFLVFGEYYLALAGNIGENTTVRAAPPWEQALTTEFWTPWPLVNAEADLDCERAIVKFDRPIYKMTGGLPIPAVLYLATTLTGPRRFLDVNLGGGAPVGSYEVVRRDDLIDQLYNLKLPAENSTWIESAGGLAMAMAGEKILAKLVEQYKKDDSGEYESAGVQPLEINGYLQQITWSVDQSGALTKWSINREHNYNVVSREEKNLISRLKIMLADLNAKPAWQGMLGT